MNNRSQGWQYAKLSGHFNEKLVCDEINTNKLVQQRLIKVSGKTGSFASASVGGLHETEVPSVFGDHTKAKPDIKVLLESGESIQVSIKKSLSGQVYLVTIDRFIECFEKQTGKEIPADVKRAISLFWGNAYDVTQIVNKYCGSFKKYELKKHRLVKETLDKYDNKYSTCMLNWFNDNIEDVFDICFSKGAAKDSENWADVVWYINKVGDVVVDDMFNLNRLKEMMPSNAQFGNRGGGTTIQLPFGFVQWHSPLKTIPGCMQFHHKYHLIESLVNEK